MKKGIPIVVAILGIFLLWGCYPQGPDYIEEMDVVIANYKNTYDFGSKATYAMPDRIVKITGNLVEGEDPEFIPDVTAQKVLAQIDANMQSLGWQKWMFRPTPICYWLPQPGKLPLSITIMITGTGGMTVIIPIIPAGDTLLPIIMNRIQQVR